MQSKRYLYQHSISKKEPLKSFFRYAVLLLGILIFINAIAVSRYGIINVPAILTYFLGTFLLIWGIFWETAAQKIPKILRYTVIGGLITLATVVLSLYTYGSHDDVTYQEDVILVLGGGIHGEEISTDLQNRLDTALILHEINPTAIIVVSGGQGSGENITEALAMERYLIKNGVDPSLILKEERSTSTHENFVFTKKLLDTHFDGSYTVAYVTSDFHIFRAGCLAHHAGFTNITHAHGNTTFYTIIPSGLRECLAIVKMILLDLPT